MAALKALTWSDQFLTSQWMNWTFAPRLDARSLPLVSSMSAMVKYAPAVAHFLAISAPSPWAPPVTRTVVPFTDVASGSAVSVAEETGPERSMLAIATIM